MKKLRLTAIGAAILMGISCLAACAPRGKTSGLTDEPLSGDYLADFSKGDPGEKVLFATNGYSNGSVFNTVWTSDNLTYSNGQMHLGLKAEEKTVDLNGTPTMFQYTSGEARTRYYYGYGDYEVRMKPSTSKGTASTFFVCTGPYDVYDDVPNPWDEIDIEFLGQDPTKVQFNYYADGIGNHEYMCDLGFDASEEFHNYGFRWAETYITWFVDGKPVYRVEKADVKDGEKFPSTAGRILMNYWCGTKDAEGWMGKFSGPDGKTADYEWVKTSAARTNPPGGDPYAPAKGDAYEGDWNAVTAADLAFASNDGYTVAPSSDKKSAGITYTNVSGTSYQNVNMDVTAAAANHSFMQLTVKNNGTVAVDLRINVQNGGKCLNAAASQDGEKARTDLQWGGSFFTVEAGKTAVCEVKFVGVATSVELMIDSSTGSEATRSGNVTVSNLKFAGEGQGTETPSGDPVALTFTKAENSGYTVTAAEENKSWTLNYVGKGNTYNPVTAECAALAAGKTTFSVTIRNNKDTAVTVRVDVQGTTRVDTSNGNGSGSSTDATNKTATCTGGTGLYTDLQWGGTKVTLAANEEVTLTITYDGAMAQGAVKNILIFVDSMGGDENDHDASVTVSKFIFA